MASSALRFFVTACSARLNPCRLHNIVLFSSSSKLLCRTSRNFHLSRQLLEESRITITLVMDDGTKHTIEAKKGETIYDCIKRNRLGIEGYGQCDGGSSCSTCHVIFKPKDFKNLDPIDDLEADILSYMQDSTEFSRLGCQVVCNKKVDRVEFHLPSGREDIREPKACYSMA